MPDAFGDRWNKYHLTAKQRDVLLLIVEGYKTTEIAYKLERPLIQVEQLRRSLFDKLGVSSLPEMILKARGE